MKVAIKNCKRDFKPQLNGVFLLQKRVKEPKQQNEKKLETSIHSNKTAIHQLESYIHRNCLYALLKVAQSYSIFVPQKK